METGSAGLADLVLFCRPQAFGEGLFESAPAEGGGPPAPWHFLYFLPLPQGQGSLRPIFSRRMTCCGFSRVPPPAILISCCSLRLRRRYCLYISSCSSGVLSMKRYRRVSSSIRSIRPSNMFYD